MCKKLREESGRDSFDGTFCVKRYLCASAKEVRMTWKHSKVLLKGRQSAHSPNGTQQDVTALISPYYFQIIVSRHHLFPLLHSGQIK